MTHATASVQQDAEYPEPSWLVKLVAAEPVLVGAFVGWLLLMLSKAFVDKWHWFTSDQWTNVDHYATPILAAGVTALVALIVRHFVTPYKGELSKWAVAVKDKLTDADHGVLLSLLEAKFNEFEPKLIEGLLAKVEQLESTAPAPLDALATAADTAAVANADLAQAAGAVTDPPAAPTTTPTA